MSDFQPRQAYLRVLWGPDKENMSGYINPDLLSFSYHDKDGDEADEISISLKDETGKWAGSWSPDGGMVLQAYIATPERHWLKVLSCFAGPFSLIQSTSPDLPAPFRSGQFRFL